MSCDMDVGPELLQEELTVGLLGIGWVCPGLSGKCVLLLLRVLGFPVALVDGRLPWLWERSTVSLVLCLLLP